MGSIKKFIEDVKQFFKAHRETVGIINFVIFGVAALVLGSKSIVGIGAWAMRFFFGSVELTAPVLNNEPVLAAEPVMLQVQQQPAEQLETKPQDQPIISQDLEQHVAPEVTKPQDQPIISQDLEQHVAPEVTKPQDQPIISQDLEQHIAPEITKPQDQPIISQDLEQHIAPEITKPQDQPIISQDLEQHVAPEITKPQDQSIILQNLEQHVVLAETDLQNKPIIAQAPQQHADQQNTNQQDRPAMRLVTDTPKADINTHKETTHIEKEMHVKPTYSADSKTKINSDNIGANSNKENEQATVSDIKTKKEGKHASADAPNVWHKPRDTRKNRKF